MSDAIFGSLLQVDICACACDKHVPASSAVVSPEFHHNTIVTFLSVCGIYWRVALCLLGKAMAEAGGEVLADGQKLSKKY